MRPLKSLLQGFCPNIYSIIDDNNKYWNKLQKKFEEKLDKLNLGDQTESSILITIGRAADGDETALSFLSFIDHSIAKLKALLPMEMHNAYIKMIKNFVQEFDKEKLDKPNPAYLNWLSEILVLISLISNGEYTLIEFESKLSNGKRMDYALKHKNGQTSLIDVVNIHVPNKKADSKELLALTINSKLDDKMDSKTTKLKDKTGLFILPVLWYSNEIVSEIFTYLKESNLASRNIVEPSSLVTIDGKFSFGTIISLYPKDHVSQHQIS